MDTEFIRLLFASCTLAQLGNKDQMTPIQQLAFTAMMEARGATENQVHASILHEWRPHIEVVSVLRKVDES